MEFAYTLQSGLDLGQAYTVPGYPGGDNAVNGEPWAPATDGLRNISGHANGDGTVTIYAAISTVSGSGDQVADITRSSRSPTISAPTARPRRAMSRSRRLLRRRTGSCSAASRGCRPTPVP
jgi:hypothetical protein